MLSANRVIVAESTKVRKAVLEVVQDYSIWPDYGLTILSRQSTRNDWITGVSDAGAALVIKGAKVLVDTKGAAGLGRVNPSQVPAVQDLSCQAFISMRQGNGPGRVKCETMPDSVPRVGSVGAWVRGTPEAEIPVQLELRIVNDRVFVNDGLS